MSSLSLSPPTLFLLSRLCALFRNSAIV
uniref:Uncharacterized protein n=1 Tax=Rhizophora mucronata TaxID=61149 RepID=A0A2P2P875_RHIMU